MAGMIDGVNNSQVQSASLDHEVEDGYERSSDTVRQDSQRIVLKEQFQHTRMEEQHLSLV